MWARTVEVILGCWLVMSPFIFRTPADETFLWVTDFAAGAVIVAIALVACWPRAEKVRFLHFAACGYLVLAAILAPGPFPPPGAYQNYIVVALLLLILAIIPTQSTLPPQSWKAFYEDRKAREAL